MEQTKKMLLAALASTDAFINQQLEVAKRRTILPGNVMKSAPDNSDYNLAVNIQHELRRVLEMMVPLD